MLQHSTWTFKSADCPNCSPSRRIVPGISNCWYCRHCLSTVSARSALYDVTVTVVGKLIGRLSLALILQMGNRDRERRLVTWSKVNNCLHYSAFGGRSLQIGWRVVTEKNQLTWRKFVPVPLCTVHTPHGLAWDRSWPSAIKFRQLTAWTKKGVRSFNRCAFYPIRPNYISGPVG